MKAKKTKVTRGISINNSAKAIWAARTPNMDIQIEIKGNMAVKNNPTYTNLMFSRLLRGDLY